MPKQIVIDLVVQICQYNSVLAAAKEERSKGSKKALPKGTKPDYLVPFLNYTSTNMNEYQ